MRGALIECQVSGSGPNLIWGHGLTSSRAIDDVRPRVDWTEVPARVVRYDARGHGSSESTPELGNYSWAELARDQLSLADALHMDQFISGGASMGCGTSLHAALAAPERVTALILVIPPTAWETRALQANEWERTAIAIEKGGVEAIIAGPESGPPPDPYLNDPDWYDRAAAATRTWEPSRLARVLRGASRADLPSRSQIAHLDVPALILAWSGDATHPTRTAEELHDLLPRSDLHIASTRPDLEQWTRHVSEFIASKHHPDA